MTTNENEKPTIRFTFVEMLFALVVAEIATQAAALAQSQRSATGFTWSAIWDARCAIMHLVLSIAVVATSWVGWSSSKATGNKEDSKEIFSLPFVVLLVDLLLVVLYFILARSVDRPPQGSSQFVDDRASDALWITVIFAGYLFWDVLTKLRRTAAEREAKAIVPLRIRAHRYVARGWASIACTALALVVYCVIPAPSQKGEAAWVVMRTDLALLSIVLLFRALKQASAGPEDEPTWPFRQIGPRYASSRTKGTRASLVTGATFLLFFVWSLF